MTDEWLEEAKSLEESEEKQSWWAEWRILGSLDTWEEEEEEDKGGSELHHGLRHISHILILHINTEWTCFTLCSCVVLHIRVEGAHLCEADVVVVQL